MTDEARHTTRVFGAAVLILSAFVVRPPIAAAQDYRTDDPPEAAQPTTAVAPPVSGIGWFKEPKLFTKALDLGIDKFGEAGQPKDGWYLEMSNMITGSGWVSLGPGYRHHVLDGKAFFDASAAVSWHAYKMGQGRFETTDLANKHFIAGGQVMWQDQTQVNYFGTGSDSFEDDQTQYRIRDTDFIGYATYLPLRDATRSLAFSGEVGYLHRPAILSPAGTFKPDVPETTIFFPTDPGVGLSFQPSYVHSEWSVFSDTRDHRGHPTEGHLYRGAVSTFADQSTDTFTFRQWEAEGLQFVQVRSPNWILAFHGWVVGSDVGNLHEVPFYMLPSLGGNNTLRGYSNYRFHDRNLALAQAESRWAIYKHVDAAVFFDAGSVARDFGDLDLDKTDWGVGLRLHTDTTTFARVDVAHGQEGWHFLFRTSDPLRLSRLSRRVAAVPFVP
jgi:surface antigen Omp85-like protein